MSGVVPGYPVVTAPATADRPPRSFWLAALVGVVITVAVNTPVVAFLAASFRALQYPGGDPQESELEWVLRGLGWSTGLALAGVVIVLALLRISRRFRAFHPAGQGAIGAAILIGLELVLVIAVVVLSAFA